jgi:hypothetical protein
MSCFFSWFAWLVVVVVVVILITQEIGMITVAAWHNIQIMSPPCRQQRRISFRPSFRSNTAFYHSLAKNKNNNNNDDASPPLVWKEQVRLRTIEIDSFNNGTTPSVHLGTPTGAATAIEAAAQQMWNWCIRFVVPHHLCPWAAASVATHHVISFYMVVTKTKEEESTCITTLTTTTLSKILDLVTRDFWNATQSNPPNITHESIENTAIAFIVFLNDDDIDMISDGIDDDSFMKFYQQFMRLEEEGSTSSSDWEWEDIFTLAPFHPHWRFQENHADDDDDDVLNFEKKTPFPTISMVYTSVIERAGEMATQQILERNEETLYQKRFQEWNHLYNAAIQKQ